MLHTSVDSIVELCSRLRLLEVEFYRMIYIVHTYTEKWYAVSRGHVYNLRKREVVIRIRKRIE